MKSFHTEPGNCKQLHKMHNVSSSMMPLLLGLLLLVLRIEIARSWTALGFYHNEAHPGKCFIAETLILSPGETAKLPGECAEITCNRADNGLANIRGCGSIAPPPGCEWGDYVDIELPYPRCCLRQVSCANADNLTAALEYQNQAKEIFGYDANDQEHSGYDEQRRIQTAEDVLSILDTNKI